MITLFLNNFGKRNLNMFSNDHATESDAVCLETLASWLLNKHAWLLTTALQIKVGKTFIISHKTTTPVRITSSFFEKRFLWSLDNCWQRLRDLSLNVRLGTLRICQKFVCWFFWIDFQQCSVKRIIIVVRTWMLGGKEDAADWRKSVRSYNAF